MKSAAKVLLFFDICKRERDFFSFFVVFFAFSGTNAARRWGERRAAGVYTPHGMGGIRRGCGRD